MNKKFILLALAVVIIFAFLLLTPALMLLGIFDSDDETDDASSKYVNARDYISVLNKNLKNGNGYVSLSRISYFLEENSNLTYDEVYTDNLNLERKQEKPITEVCNMDKYKDYEVCSTQNITESSQKDIYEEKPFVKPINFNVANVSSIFNEKRSIGVSSVHKAWDISAPAKTPVYAVCDGMIEYVKFPYKKNIKNMSDTSGGNRIKLNCETDEQTYSIYYMHLYPNSYKVKKGQKVSKKDVLASVGTTGMSTGNHLHFQVNLNKKEVDGLNLINFQN